MIRSTIAVRIAVLPPTSGPALFIQTVFSANQNQRPCAAAVASVMKAHTIDVPTNRPNPIAMLFSTYVLTI